MNRKAEVVIIGGGSTGSSILYNLARQGLTDCILVERGGQVASGQTSRSTALIRTHYSNPVVAEMALRSYRFFQRFEEQLPGYSCGFKQTGLLIGADPLNEKGIVQNLDMFKKLGIVSNIIDKDEAKRIEPHLNTDGYSAVVYEPQAGYAEPSTTTSSFAQASQKMGATILTNMQVRQIEKKSGQNYSLKTSGGEIQASNVVVATGVWSTPLFESLGLSLPIKSARHPVGIYKRPEQYSGMRPFIFDFPRKAYYKPEGQRDLVVGTLEFDSSKKEIDPDNYDQDISFEEVAKFSNCVSEAIPVMGTEGRYERGFTGLYDETPDQQPIIDEFSSDGFEGLYCLVGLSGHGFKLCPEFGRIMSQLICKRNFTDYDVSVFQRERFVHGKLLKSKYQFSAMA